MLEKNVCPRLVYMLLNIRDICKTNIQWRMIRTGMCIIITLTIFSQFQSGTYDPGGIQNFKKFYKNTFHKNLQFLMY